MTPTPIKIRIAEHIEISWPAAQSEPASCPNCGSTENAPRVLDIAFRRPDGECPYIVHRCPRCSARFFDNIETMDYGTAELIEMGWHTYQIQLGAGLWPIAAPLTQIDKPPGALILEIGGAYGFGLDFATHARHWKGRGYDPSPLADFGARELGLDMTQRYFTETDLQNGRYDLVIATEVIEHLPDPPAFLRLMAGALEAGGILLLTTPDGEKITPALDPAELLPMLSPGAHLVLQTAASLRHALLQAGFKHVEIQHGPASLIAHASASPFRIQYDTDAGRQLYRGYLLQRARGASSGSDLCLGFAGRALFEAVNDADCAGAAQAWTILLAAARDRFGIDLETMTGLPEDAALASLAQLARLLPLGLGMIEYSRGLWQLLEGVPRARVLPCFRLALAAIDALQAALAKRSLTDGLSAVLRTAAETEIALCLADSGAADCISLVMAMPRHTVAHTTASWRVFILLVNRGFLERAGELQQLAGLYAPAAELDENLRRDALFTTGILALSEPRDWPRALSIFIELRQALLRSPPPGNVPPLFWQALRGEITALHRLGRSDHAMTLLAELISSYAGAPEDLRRQLDAASASPPDQDAPRLNAGTADIRLDRGRIDPV